MSMPSIARAWTLEELDRLPDDGNRYEIVEGELFVTPAPSEEHETIAARLTRVLDPFVATHGLGAVYRPRAVMQVKGSQVEPDLMVRTERMRRAEAWQNAPLPILVVEILSGTTRRRDHVQKRALYMKAGVAEYWIVDAGSREVHVIRPRARDEVERETLRWRPAGANAELSISLADLFAGLLGDEYG